MTRIMSHGFHACDSLEHLTWFISFEWLTQCYGMTDVSHGCISRYDSLQVMEVYVA